MAKFYSDLLLSKGINPDAQSYMSALREYTDDKLDRVRHLLSMCDDASTFDPYDPDDGGVFLPTAQEEWDEQTIRNMANRWIDEIIAADDGWSSFGNPYMLLSSYVVSVRELLVAIALDAGLDDSDGVLMVTDYQSGDKVSMQLIEVTNEILELYESIGCLAASCSALSILNINSITDRISAFKARLGTLLQPDVTSGSETPATYENYLATEADPITVTYKLFESTGLFNYTSILDECTDSDTGEIDDTDLSNAVVPLMADCDMAHYTGVNPLSGFTIGDGLELGGKALLKGLKGLGNLVLGIFGTSIDAIGSSIKNIRSIMTEPTDLKVVNTRGNFAIEGTCSVPTWRFATDVTIPPNEDVLLSTHFLTVRRQDLYAPLQMSANGFQERLTAAAVEWNSKPVHTYSTPFAVVKTNIKVDVDDPITSHTFGDSLTEDWDTIALKPRNSEGTYADGSPCTIYNSAVHGNPDSHDDTVAIQYKIVNYRAVRAAITQFQSDHPFWCHPSELPHDPYMEFTSTAAFSTFLNEYLYTVDCLYEPNASDDLDEFAYRGLAQSIYLCRACNQAMTEEIHYDAPGFSVPDRPITLCMADQLTIDRKITNADIMSLALQDTGYNYVTPDSFFPLSYWDPTVENEYASSGSASGWAYQVCTSIFLNLLDKQTFPVNYPFLPYTTAFASSWNGTYSVLTDNDRIRQARTLLSTIIAVAVMIVGVVAIRRGLKKRKTKKAWKREQVIARTQSKMWNGEKLTKKEMKAYKRALKKGGGVASLFGGSTPSSPISKVLDQGGKQTATFPGVDTASLGTLIAGPTFLG